MSRDCHAGTMLLSPRVVFVRQRRVRVSVGRRDNNRKKKSLICQQKKKRVTVEIRIFGENTFGFVRGQTVMKAPHVGKLMVRGR